MKTKRWNTVAFIALMMGALCLSACKSKEQKAAEAAQMEYEDLVETCRNKIKKADEPADLNKVKDKLIDVADFEEMYGRVMPEVYCKAEALQKQFDKKVENLKQDVMKMADAYIEDNDYFDALQTVASLSELDENSGEELKNLMREWAPMMGYIRVTDVEYANCEKDASDIEPVGTTLHSDKMRYLYPRLTFDSMLPEERPAADTRVLVKIFNPDGTMKTGSDSPNGYTYASNIKVDPVLKNQKKWLKGYGNATTSCYTAGTYKVEYYIRGILIYRNEVVIH